MASDDTIMFLTKSIHELADRVESVLEQLLKHLQERSSH